MVKYFGGEGVEVVLFHGKAKVRYESCGSLILKEDLQRLVESCSYGYVEDKALQLCILLQWEYNPRNLEVTVFEEGIVATCSQVPLYVHGTEVFKDVLLEAMEVEGFTSFVELLLLAAEARKCRGGWFVELGSAEGRSAMVLCKAARLAGSSFVTVDRCMEQSLTMEVLRSRGGRTAQRETWDVPDYVDEVAFLFMDASHDKKGVLAELDAWLPLVVEGGTVAVHDYENPEFPGVKEAVRGLGEPWWQHGHLAVWRKENG